MQDSQPSTLSKAVTITGVSLVLGLFFDYFFYGKIPGIAFPIYVVLVVAGLFVVAKVCQKQINREIFWLLPPLLFFSGMIFVRSSELLTFLNIAASLLLLLLIAGKTFDGKLKNFLFADYIKIFFLPFGFIRPLLGTLSGLLAPRAYRKGSSQIVKGVLMAIPILFIFLLLFSSADLVFKKYILDLIGLEINPELILRSVLIVIVTLVFIGAYSYSFGENENQIAEPRNGKIYTIGQIETSIVLGSVTVLFFLFILIQLTYLFGGESTISAKGFTYAEYARRGFFELIAVAVISFLLLLAAEKYIAKKESYHTPGFKIQSTVLVVLVMLIMASAFMRLSLYEEAYGFTVLRLFSHAFIILLAVIFGLLLYKIYGNNAENVFAFRVFISIVLFLAVMNFLNPDAFIARRNIERFSAADQLDVHYLSRLSDDALPETVRILNMPDEEVRKSFARDLYWRTQRNDSAYFSGWQSLNISRMRAKKILDSRIHELEPCKDYQAPERLIP